MVCYGSYCCLADYMLRNDLQTWSKTAKNRTLKYFVTYTHSLCDLHMSALFVQLPINLISHFENIFCFAISVYVLSTNLSIWREKIMENVFLQ